MKTTCVRLYDIPMTWLLVYFSGKMLFDKIPYVFELATVAMVCIYAICWFACQPYRSTHKATLLVVFVLFFAYVLINALLQCSLAELLRAMYEYVFYICIFFAVSYLIPRADMGRCLTAFLVWGFVIAGLSWVEYFTKSYLIADHSYNLMYDPTYGFRASVFTRSYLSHGTILGIFALVGMGLFYIRGKWRYAVAAVFCYVAVLATASRGPLVAAGVALVCQFLLNAFISRKHSRKRFGAVALLGIAALVAMAVMFGTFETGNGTIDYFLFRVRSVFNWKGDAGNVGRLEVWARSIEWFKTNILFGIGPSKTGSWRPDTWGVTESGVLKRLCELGVLGAALYYFFVGKILVRGVSLYGKSSYDGKKMMLIWIGVAIAILINDCILQVTEEIMVSFFLFAAFAGIDTAGEQNV